MNVAIIAGAGEGTRFGGKRAKQFRDLAGIPIIIHTLRRFEQSASIGEIIVVVPAGEVPGFLQLAGKFNLGKLARVVAGGATRMESVFRGLQAVRAATAEVVAVHDGVRPFVSTDEIDRTMNAAREVGAAILAAPASDTIKEVRKRRVVGTLLRAETWHALTPQCFRYDILRRAYERALAETVVEATDDSQLVERLGLPVAVVEGDPRNIKITRPEDIALAEILLREVEM